MSYLAKVKVQIEQMMKEQRQIFESYWIILDVVLFKEKYRRIISNTPIVLYYSFSCSCSVTSLLKFFWSWDIRSMQDCFTKFLENNILNHKYCLCGNTYIQSLLLDNTSTLTFKWYLYNYTGRILQWMRRRICWQSTKSHLLITL